MFRNLGPVFWLLSIAVVVKADTVTINFEGLPDGTNLTTQYTNLGVTFSNAVIETAGMSLDQSEFPPRSGTNVIASSSYPALRIDFSKPVSDFTAYVTYKYVLQFEAFGSIQGGAFVKYNNNEALSGDPGSSPNEKLEFTSSTGIEAIRADYYDFTLDDISFTTLSVPEIDPDSCAGALTLLAGALLIFRGKKTKPHNTYF